MSLVGTTQVQVGAVLVLGGGGSLDIGDIRAAFEQRLPADPRLRRRLRRVPPGCGRPLWVDDGAFDIAEHVVEREAQPPLSRDQLLDLAAELVADPLPMDRSLWRATLVPGVAPDRTALVVVFHHVLADGLAGLTLLADLLSPGPAPVDLLFPRPAPVFADLLTDAVRQRLGSVRRLPALLLRLWAAGKALGPGLRAEAQPCSLNQPPGRHRVLRTISVDLPEVVGLAHRHGVTVNDVLLTAVAGALGILLTGRGEHVPWLVASVPFSAPTNGSPATLGNHSGAVPLRLPTSGSFAERLTATAAATRDAKRQQRGATTAVLAPTLRLLDRFGLYQRFIDHQRLVHTFVSNVRGPAAAVTFLGHPVLELLPLSPAAGNVTVAFTALSYRGHLVVALNADPDSCPDLDRLIEALGNEFAWPGEPLVCAS